MKNFNLNYYLHLLLHSKYKTIINFLLISSLYIILKNSPFVFCMTEGNEIPSIAETKTIVEANIESKKEIPKELNCAISSMSEKISEQRDEILNLKAKVRYLNAENQSLLDRIYGDDDPDDYDANPPLFYNRLFWGNLYGEEDDF